MSATHAYDVSAVSKTYLSRGGGPSTQALTDVNLTIGTGLLATIVGPSGSGKSTLLGLLGLLDLPTEGTLSVAGELATDTPERVRCRMRAKHIGFVFQSFHLMHGRSALENVMLGGLYRGIRRSARFEEARRTLDQVGLLAKADKPAGTLSGGERQRAAIARALVGRPRILLCDEPTGNLDSRNGYGIVEVLRALPDADVCVVVVTHDQRIARLGDQQIEVVDGRVSGDGCG